MGKVLRVLAIAVGLVIGAYVAFMALLLVAVLVLQPGEAPMDEADYATPPLPLSFHIQLGYSREVANRDFELRLDPADVAALNLADATVASDSSGGFDVVTPLPSDAPQRTHCLLGRATIVDTVRDVQVAVIPAATCIGSDELVVPTADVPAIRAQPENTAYSGVSEPDPLAGELQVHIDGCSTIAGRRMVWPDGTVIDEAGRIVLEDGRTLTPGDLVAVEVRDLTNAPIPAWCAGDPHHVVGVE